MKISSGRPLGRHAGTERKPERVQSATELAPPGWQIPAAAAAFPLHPSCQEQAW
jgi:hypothetical protein